MSLLSFMLLENIFLKEIFIFNFQNYLRKRTQGKSFEKSLEHLEIRLVFTDFFQTTENIILEKNSTYTSNYIFTAAVLSKNISKDYYTASM